MRFKLIGLTLLATFVIENTTQAQGADFGRGSPASISELRSRLWYDKGYAKPTPTTLKGALEADKEILGPDSPSYSLGCGEPLRKALAHVGLECNYAILSGLSMFLSFNGKGMFPASAGTNPYCTMEDRREDKDRGADTRPDDCYIGTVGQNMSLVSAVNRNALLFQGGDLTAQAVKEHWR